ncbi:amidohydrolase [Metabacillus sp. RGM 3146]|uniref:amidohydrolase n=1 Tax=Metabacillus sp. RGM 3146 TaxID=3401092 RepID=UPI003B9DA730
MGTIWYGGTIYTMEKEHETIEAVFTEKDRIIEIGSKEALLNKYEGRIAEYNDLNRAVMLPGFTDSHIHLIGHGEKLMRLDFSGMHSQGDIINALQKEVRQANHGEWIIGEGWNENQLAEGQMFDRHLLDDLFPGCPIILKRICRHANLASSAALEAAGITKDMPDPAGGIIGRDENGELTGFLMDLAMDLLYTAAPGVTEGYMEKALNLAVSDCYRYGITGVHTEDLSYYGSLEKTLAVFKKVIEEKKRRLKVHMLVHHTVAEELEAMNPVFSSYLETGAVKIFSDGALGGRTALLSEPYTDDPVQSGVAVHTPEELTALVKMARKLKREVAVHAIGDLAFERTMDAIEADPPLEVQRDRIIHAQILRTDLIKRAKKLPIILDIQPGFTASDFPWVIERLGEDRMTSSFAWKTLLEEGIICAGGSDAPIEPLNPFLGIHAAVTRKSIHTPEQEGYYMQEALSAFEAIQLYTIGSARAVHKEASRGLIKEDYEADFTIIDRDPFRISSDELKKTMVVMTVIDGQIVFQL